MTDLLLSWLYQFSIVFAAIYLALALFGPWVIETGIRRALRDDALRRRWLQPEAPAEPIDCPECGAEVPGGTSHCLSCGWTYRTGDG